MGLSLALLTFGAGLILVAEIVAPIEDSVMGPIKARREKKVLAGDAFLRENGWRIKDRPLYGPAMWVHASGLELSAKEAFKHIAVCRERIGVAT